MMNVFGKTRDEYKHIKKLKDKGQLDRHLKALRTSFVDAAEPSQGFGFGTNNLQAIQSEIEEVLYLNFRYVNLYQLIMLLLKVQTHMHIE
jgi:hypothetical protein